MSSWPGGPKLGVVAGASARDNPATLPGLEETPLLLAGEYVARVTVDELTDCEKILGQALIQ